jgi:hypothetical protein
VIRNGFSLFSSQATAAKGINSDAPSQVTSNTKAAGKRVKKSWQERETSREEYMQEALAFEQKLGVPLSKAVQVYKDRLDGKEKEPKPPANSGGKGIGQCVLGETFCYNRVAEMSRLAGNSKLSDFTDKASVNSKVEEVKSIQLFKRFQRENDSGDPPYFCVSRLLILKRCF